MGFFQKLGFIKRMMADPEVDELYRELKSGGLRMLAEPSMKWWLEQAAFLHAHSMEAAVKNGMKVGKEPRVEPNVTFMGHRLISIGDFFVCSTGCSLRAVDAEINIGRKVSFGPYVLVIGANHGMEKDTAVQDQPQKSSRVDIGDDVWVGAGSILLPGVEIGEGVVVAAGSVVKEKVEPMTVVAGAPAKPVSQRK